MRANTTTTEPLADGTYRIVGHKWFTSAPMNDLFLTLAQTSGGLSCFLVPRVLPDGSRNEIRLQPLKDRLGNKSNASAEIEYAGALGHLIGEGSATSQRWTCCAHWTNNRPLRTPSSRSSTPPPERARASQSSCR